MLACAAAHATSARAAMILNTFSLLEGRYVVREVRAKSASLDDVRDARRLLGGDIARADAMALQRTDTVNFVDPDNGIGGHFDDGTAFPGDQVGDDDQSFAVRVRGRVAVPEAGTYT